jgi:hypothetical protein
MSKNITLDDVVKGEQFKSKIVELLSVEGLLLSERHENLHSDDLPKIVQLSEDADGIKFTFECCHKTYSVTVCQSDFGVVKAGLCWLYGFGMIRYDYSLPIFDELPDATVKKYMNLAIEIWERNVHRDWMQRYKKYKVHNGDASKGPSFLFGIISGGDALEKAKEEHHSVTDEGILDSKHHIFRDKEKLRLLMLSEGKNIENHNLLVESIFDQVTATTRRWLRDKRPFEVRLFKNMELGYFIKKGEPNKPDERWTPGVFGFTNEYEDSIWKIWCKAHEEFREYWIKKFGKNEEFLQQPAPE